MILDGENNETVLKWKEEIDSLSVPRRLKDFYTLDS